MLTGLNQPGWQVGGDWSINIKLSCSDDVSPNNENIQLGNRSAPTCSPACRGSEAGLWKWAQFGPRDGSWEHPCPPSPPSPARPGQPRTGRGYQYNQTFNFLQTKIGLKIKLHTIWDFGIIHSILHVCQVGTRLTMPSAHIHDIWNDWLDGHCS